MKKTVLAILILFIVGYFSYTHTYVMWDGGFPAGDFRINLTNSGLPVEGAELKVYSSSDNSPAYNYPFDNFKETIRLKSDSEGQVRVFRHNGGFQFGGSYFYLFWCIPFGETKGPSYYIGISKEGYKNLTIELNEFFKNSLTTDKGYSKTILESGEEVILIIYEQNYELTSLTKGSTQ